MKETFSNNNLFSFVFKENELKNFFHRILGTNNVSRISLLNVKEIFEKHKDEESKGIKAHFRLDDSGLINLDKVMLIK